jgi:hypothetical protein
VSAFRAGDHEFYSRSGHTKDHLQNGTYTVVWQGMLQYTDMSRESNSRGYQLTNPQLYPLLEIGERLRAKISAALCATRHGMTLTDAVCVCVSVCNVTPLPRTTYTLLVKKIGKSALCD